jgi:hypothetical protein
VVISKRERYIVILTAVLVGSLLLYYLAVGPLLERKSLLDTKVADDTLRVRRNKKTMETRDQMTPGWQKMLAGPLKRDASVAESQMVGNVIEWGKTTGVNLSSLNPQRTTDKEKDFYKISLRAAGTGGIDQIGKFLFQIQNADIPVKVTDLQIGSRKEGVDDLSFQMGISTIYLSPDADKPKPPGAPAAPANKEVLP